MPTNNQLRAHLGYGQRNFEIELHTIVVVETGFLFKSVIMRNTNSDRDLLYLQSDLLPRLYQYALIHEIDLQIRDEYSAWRHNLPKGEQK